MDYEFFGTLAAIVVASVAVFTFLLSMKNELREDLRDVREDMRGVRGRHAGDARGHAGRCGKTYVEFARAWKV